MVARTEGSANIRNAGCIRGVPDAVSASPVSTGVIHRNFNLLCAIRARDIRAILTNKYRNKRCSRVRRSIKGRNWKIWPAATSWRKSRDTVSPHAIGLPGFFTIYITRYHCAHFISLFTFMTYTAFRILRAFFKHQILTTTSTDSYFNIEM